MFLFFPSVATDDSKHFQCLNIQVLKIKTGPLFLETFSAFLSMLFNLKKMIDSPKALPPSYRRLLSGDYITGRRGVICDLDCSLYPCTTHRLCFYNVESSKPSFDFLINLVKYYAMLRKTAEGNNYGRITTRLTYNIVPFSSVTSCLARKAFPNASSSLGRRSFPPSIR